MGDYCIIRFFKNSYRRRVIKTGVTLEEARKHCNDPETSSSTCTTAACKRRTRQYGAWFDGYSDKICRGR